MVAPRLLAFNKDTSKMKLRIIILLSLSLVSKVKCENIGIDQLIQNCVNRVKSIPNCQFNYTTTKGDRISYNTFIKYDSMYTYLTYENEKFQKIIRGVSYDGKSFYKYTSFEDRNYLLTGSNVGIAKWEFRSYFVTNPLYSGLNWFAPMSEEFSLPGISESSNWLDAFATKQMPIKHLNSKESENESLGHTFEHDDGSGRVFLLLNKDNNFAPFSVSGKLGLVAFSWKITESLELKLNSGTFDIPVKTELIVEFDKGISDPELGECAVIDKNTIQILEINPGASTFQIGVNLANEIFDADLGQSIKK